MKKVTAILLKIISLTSVVGVWFLIIKSVTDGGSDYLFDLDKALKIDDYPTLLKIYYLTREICLLSAVVCCYFTDYAVDIFFKYDKKKRKKNLAALAASVVIFTAFISTLFLTREKPFIYNHGFFLISIAIALCPLSCMLRMKINPKKVSARGNDAGKEVAFDAVETEVMQDKEKEITSGKPVYDETETEATNGKPVCDETETEATSGKPVCDETETAIMKGKPVCDETEII